MINRILGNSLPQTISDMQQEINQLGVVPSSYRGDWYEIAEPFAYDTTVIAGITYNRIAVVDTSVDLFKMFSIGTPIRFKQGGDYKYFYVMNVAPTYIVIYGGSDYTLVNAAITDLAKGINSVPIDFPVVFNIDSANYSASSGTITFSVTATDTVTTFHMVGPVVIVNANVFNASVSVNDVTVLLNIPYTADLNSSGPRPNYSFSVASQFGVVELRDLYTLEIYPTLYEAGFSNVAQNTNFFFEYSYTVF